MSDSKGTSKSLGSSFLYCALCVVVFWSGNMTSALEGRTLVEPMFNIVAPQGLWLPYIYVNMMVESIPMLAMVMCVVLALINSTIITIITIRQAFYVGRSYLPALVYLIVSAGIYDSPWQLNQYIAAFLMLIMLKYIYSSFNSKRECTGLFLKAGFYFGLAAMMSLNVWWLVWVVFVGIGMFRVFSLREWVAALVGVLAPVFICSYGSWMVGADILDVPKVVLQVFIPVPNFLNEIQKLLLGVPIVEWVYVGVLLLAVLLSLIYMVKHRATYKSSTLKVYALMLWMLFFVLAGMILGSGVVQWGLSMPVLAIAMAVIVPIYFRGNNETGVMPNTMYYLVLGTALAVNVFRFYD